MVNMGKLRSVARWLMLLRAAQLSPYRFDEKAVNRGSPAVCVLKCRYVSLILFDKNCATDIFARLMKPPAFAGHDAQWERSVALEKKS